MPTFLKERARKTRPIDPRRVMAGSMFVCPLFKEQTFMACAPPSSYRRGKPYHRTWRTKHDHSWMWSRTRAHSNDTCWKTKKSRMKHMDKHFWMERAVNERSREARQTVHHVYDGPAVGGHYAQFYRMPSTELLSREHLTMDGTALSTKYCSELRSSRGFISNKKEHEFMKRKMPVWLNSLANGITINDLLDHAAREPHC